MVIHFTSVHFTSLHSVKRNGCILILNYLNNCNKYSISIYIDKIKYNKQIVNKKQNKNNDNDILMKIVEQNELLQNEQLKKHTHFEKINDPNTIISAKEFLHYQFMNKNN